MSPVINAILFASLSPYIIQRILAFPSHSSLRSPLKMSTETAVVQSSPAPAPKKMMEFSLLANDGEKVTVQEDVAFQSNLLKKMVSDLGISSSDDAMLSDSLPISNVNGWTLNKIMEWCTVHRGETYKPKEEHEDPRITLTNEDRVYMDVTSDQLHAMLMVRSFLAFL